MTEPEQTPRLYEISAMVNWHTVILAVSEADALEHIKTWERSWNDANADFVGVSDVDVYDVRDVRDPTDAHDITAAAAAQRSKS